MLCAAKCHVLDHVGEPALIFVLEHRAGVHHQSELGALFRLVILANVVAHAVAERADRYRGVERERSLRGWWSLRKERRCARRKKQNRAGGAMRESQHSILRGFRLLQRLARWPFSHAASNSFDCEMASRNFWPYRSSFIGPTPRTLPRAVRDRGRFTASSARVRSENTI